MATAIEICKSLFGLDDSFRIIDLGSGVGKPSWHFAVNDVELSIGIDSVPGRYMASQRASLKILEEYERNFSLGFACIDILQLRELAFFDLVYMFDCGFNPVLLKHISKLIGYGRCRYLVSYYNPHTLLENGFCVSL